MQMMMREREVLKSLAWGIAWMVVFFKNVFFY